jgi:hypothetical protein
VRFLRWLVSLFRRKSGKWSAASSLPAVPPSNPVDPRVFGESPTRFRIVRVHKDAVHRTNLGLSGRVARDAWERARADEHGPPGAYFFYDRDVIRGSFTRE